jgi:hypothetical protein
MHTGSMGAGMGDGIEPESIERIGALSALDGFGIASGKHLDSVCIAYLPR